MTRCLVHPLMLAGCAAILLGTGVCQEPSAKLATGEVGGGHQVVSRVPADLLAQLSGSLQQLARTLSPAVVQIQVTGFGPAEQAETKVNARHVIGLENVKRNRAGKLTVQNGVMQFDTGKTTTEVPTASIEDISIGSETTQAGGKAGTVVKTAAIAAPYDSGAALSLLLRTKVDILAVSYRDSDGGLHAAILALPRNQAEQEWAQLIAAGARARAPAEQELKVTKASVLAAERANVQKLSASAIQIEPVEAGDVGIPAEFRSAIYEFLVERVREAGTFRQVFRSGDRASGSIPGLVTLHTTVENFKQGSQMKREVTGVLGATKVDVSATLTAGDGRTLMDSRIQGKVRFFGENLGATNNLAKSIDKLLRKNFGTKPGH